MTTHLVVLGQLVELLGRIPQVIIRVARPGELLPGELGATLFLTHEILLRPGLDPRTARTTLAHELVHLLRGPCFEGDEHAEEQAVRALTAQILLPPPGWPPTVDTPTTAAGLAERYLIDTDAATLALELARGRHGEVA
ncbi:ImmA/IrrE family metallo-endopeptidase [Labedaea rhizosphaerae]|uniref:IrrE N-terminal-like domain-containing protein n=1 Tax=Labedaea rhizosphaerae TaxID=598644 RepID=A0A4R6SCL2_LABRH|nr:hypothetical protein [Labedaea rhizosphaerae]TDP97682.1 hypothetical protein EV186_103646 [Labedaea rhizosphaerae]